MLSLFDQFMSPALLGIPLIALAVLLPSALFPHPTPDCTTNRPLMLQGWLTQKFTHQLFLPLNFPSHKWALLFAAMMIYLVGINLLGLLPYTFTPTTQLSHNMGFAIPLWLATVIIGFRNQPTSALGHLLPEGTPSPLVPALIIIESISLLIRPLALGVRLTANLTAGHLLMQLTATAFLALLQIPYIAAMTGTLLMMLTLLETAVAIIQAYVFILLLSLYLQENT
uniref:ATP synthase subunit a n=1 Tax=Zebrias crossolepis TaxID=366939 RepID=A0A0X9UXU3_ZEBCR|nr:ATP synthase F0 subunit 6 [Zebrias crossolepis]AID59823.1 ATP synthase F0 subunit 6 [Zebrias crossolepis]AMA34328.1 ATP synthase F0 subunit 6 [Zebrias crossolepis]